MRSKQGAKCCFAGAMLASISWGLIFFLYANLDLSQQRNNQLVNVPRRLLPSHNAVQSSLTDIDADENQPGHYKAKPLQGVGKVKQGLYADPVKAGQIFTQDDQKQYNEGISHHAFNSYLSDRLMLNRPIPDTRDERCSSLSYDVSTLTQVSIVMCFYNEALSVLLRSLHSIYERTKPSLIKEVILVDDNSQDAELKKNLDSYIEENFSIQITVIRNDEREGLIRSRMIGARAATAKVLVFLDSHIEVNTGWLEPLVSRVTSSEATIVLPLIDIIDSDTFQYKKSPLVRGGFTWSMRFSWEQIPGSILQDNPLYIRSPTMAGGLLAISKDYFFRLGGYDTGMNIWGGENIEMSFRVWMCGGKIEMAICSRVGHIFRRVRPYSSPTGEDTMTRNTLRMVNVWLDDSKEMYHKATENRFTNTEYGDISERKILRDSLNCKDFKWYLDTVYNPDTRGKIESAAVAKPMDDKRRKSLIRKTYLNIVNKGKLRLSDTEYCVIPSSLSKTSRNSPLVLTDCSSVKLKWYELETGGFLIDSNKCLDVVSSAPTITKCTDQGGTQQWIMQNKEMGSGYLYNPGVGLCLHAPKQRLGIELKMSPCDKVTPFIYDKKVIA